VKKASVQKALDALVDSGELQMKEFGKAKVYLLNQGSIPTVDEKDMERLKANLNKVKKEHDAVNEEVKDLNAMLKDLNSQLTDEQIEEEIKKYQKSVCENILCEY
jgi:26S proteasome regulatory subunit, ATPase 3, interacting protein